MKFKYNNLDEVFNKSIVSKNRTISGAITKEDIDRLNNDFMEEIIEYPLDETLDKSSSLKYHYKKHVRKYNEPKEKYNIQKYDFMSQEEYYEHAKNISKITPQIIIGESINDKYDINQLAESFIFESAKSLMIDYNLTNKADGHKMIAIFNKNIDYPGLYELCLVDMIKNEPITIFLIARTKILKYFNDFLGIF